MAKKNRVDKKHYLSEENPDAIRLDISLKLAFLAASSKAENASKEDVN